MCALVSVGKHVVVTRCEGLWNDDGDGLQRSLVLGQPSLEEVSKSRPAEHIRAPFESTTMPRTAARQAAPFGVGDLLPAHACAYHFFE